MRIEIVSVATLLIACSAVASAQAPAGDSRAIVIANPDATFPAQQRALAAPDVIQRGNGLYQVNCQACHGADLRGGDQGGPNLLRSEIVLNDVSGETIGQIVAQGRNRMPANTSLDRGAVEAIAAYIHSVVATSERQGAPPQVEYDLNILVGSVPAGEAYFNKECTACHSVTGDLNGIGSRIPDPVDLQNSWVAGRRQGSVGAPASSRSTTTVTVTLPNGERVGGELLRHDDFFVSLRTADGTYRSFTRKGNRPAVSIDDPLSRHRELLSELTDDVMHDVTAYLETLK
jgi:cytochrome c oxidase cbb3-type subunit 3